MKLLAAWRLAALCLSLSLTAALAQEIRQYPTGRFASSSASRRAAATTSSRAIFGQKLSESLGQPVIIENKPGARRDRSPPNMSRGRRPTVTRCWSAPAAPW